MSTAGQVWAHVQDGTVREIYTIPLVVDGMTIYDLFTNGTEWNEITDVVPPPGEGWTFDGNTYAPPQPPTQTVETVIPLLLAYGDYVSAAGILFQPETASTPSLFATDEASTSKLTSAFSMVQIGLWPAEGPWRAADGTYPLLTPKDVTALAKSAAAYVQMCMAFEATLALRLQTDPTIDYTVGWPPNGPYYTNPPPPPAPRIAGSAGITLDAHLGLHTGIAVQADCGMAFTAGVFVSAGAALEGDAGLTLDAHVEGLDA